MVTVNQVAPTQKPVAGQPRSVRGRLRYEETLLRPIDQIRIAPGRKGVEATGTFAYFIRPDGATIREALVIYPNGGIPEMSDERLRNRYATNSEYYRERQRRKGFEFVGTTLTEAGIRRLVEVLAANREDEVLYCQDEVVNCEATVKTADKPELRDQARKRKRQFERRLETLNQDFDPDGMIAELKEIAHAQMLAKVDPNILRVMRSMIGEVNEKTATLISHFQMRSGAEGAPRGLSGSGSGGGTEFDAGGRNSLEV